MRGEQQRTPRLLVEVEVPAEVAQDRLVLADVRTAVGPAVGPGVDPPAAEEVVLDELEVRVEAGDLVDDVAAPRVRADHDAGDAEPVPASVDDRRLDVVVDAA